ncbi:hypothetical protein DFA_06904 [Cavenderia fasciculata]|uniref:Glutaredoxin domain-containing protein n=1 Tax=Cavenderia fasciculata TaxID=261658 RepID=F4PWZ9_CACFS|nr:uncharacterized protein DFA_06904 [Cavenderia fasciculata]EGG19802.1 hypothetical protein DFA_06904 [Cavenderia fasciculata]|eukprot:XP_004358148.1 hypothetical protein DFA_06904 [Cavenderia fasciculata]
MSNNNNNNINRPILQERSKHAVDLTNNYFPEVINEVEQNIKEHDVVVVGMAYNPFVKNIRKELTDAGVPFKYLEYGSYFSAWDKRLAIKMWSGYPTFPQVFKSGELLGGYDVASASIKDGSFKNSTPESSSK